MHNHYSYKILEQSRQNIITLENVKNYTRISGNNDDILLESMINSAIQIAENFIKISLVKKQVALEVDNMLNVKLPLTPVIRIITITVDDVAINLSNFLMDRETLILPKYVEGKKLKIIYEGGYPDASLVPAPIIEGILLHIANMYDARGGGSLQLDGIFALYQPYRKMSL